jgi:hypothetical protein
MSHQDVDQSQMTDRNNHRPWITAMGRSSSDLWAITLLVSVVLFFYWDFVTGRNYVWDDTLKEYYPGVNYFARSIAAGRFPLWFPGVRDGSPFYSDTQIAVFYPLQWILPLFVKAGRLPFLVYQRYIILHCLLGAVFAYAFLRELKLRPISALAGAFGFCFSGFFVMRMNVNFVMIQVYIWLPLQLLFVHRFVSKRGRWRWLGLVGGMLMSLLGGHPQTTVYCWYLVIAYWLYRSYLSQRDKVQSWKSALGRCTVMEAPKIVGTFALVFGIAAVMLLPGVENWWHTGRPKQSFQAIADPSLPYRGLLRLLIPNFFGGWGMQPGGNSFWGADPQSPSVLQTGTIAGKISQSAHNSPGFWQYWECNAYSGQIFLLALVLILSNWKRVANKRTVGFFLIVWLMALWFMLGRYGGLFNLLYRVLPGASAFRGPAKMSCVATFAAAVVVAHLVELVRSEGVKLRLWPAALLVAGYTGFVAVLDFGGEHLMAELQDWDKLSLARDETWYAVTIMACSFASIWAARHTKQSARVVGLLALLTFFVADVYHSCGSFKVRQNNPDELYYRAAPEVAQTMDLRAQRGPFRCAQLLSGRIAEEWAWPRNLPYFYDSLEVPEGYTSYYLDNISQFQGITNEQSKTDIQNIETVFTWDLQRNLPVVTSVDCLPRAKFFSRVRRYESRTALLAALDRNEIDWRNEAAVWGPVPVVTDRGVERNTPTGTNDEVRFISKTPEAYSIVYHVNQPGIVFVSQTSYPGWIANGGRVSVVEVFGAFQGIVIPEAGRGEITVVFSPPILKLGLSITILSVMTAVFVCIFIANGNSPPATDSL